MNFDALISGVLVRRYKRFLADIQLDSGEMITAHCPNSGALAGVTEPGLHVWVSYTPSPRRRLNYTWHMVEVDGICVGVNTWLPQKLVRENLYQGNLPFQEYTQIQEEVPYGLRSRIDFLLTSPDHPPCYLELKNVHWKRGSTACFPDAPTLRGTKHLKQLADQVLQGHRAVVLYVVQRHDCTRFQIASDIDPLYAQAATEAHKIGVEFLCYGCHLSPQGIHLLTDQPL